jgi:hypothetical protein
MPQKWPVLADNRTIAYDGGRCAAKSGKNRMNSFSQLTRRAVLGLGFLALAAFPALAAKPIDVTPEQAAAINELSEYLNSFKTIQGEFTQISPKGNLSRGVFFIKKPGKMRFEYAPPNPFLIVADGRWLTIKNVKKEKGDQFPLSQTPLRLVLGNKVDILKDTKILAYEEQDGIASPRLRGAGRHCLDYGRGQGNDTRQRPAHAGIRQVPQGAAAMGGDRRQRPAHDRDTGECRSRDRSGSETFRRQDRPAGSEVALTSAGLP